MTPDLIKQWAIQSGFTGQECLSWWTDLSKFAALVAAHQRELDARACEKLADDAPFVEELCVRLASADCAAAIRGRGE